MNLDNATGKASWLTSLFHFGSEVGGMAEDSTALDGVGKGLTVIGHILKMFNIGTNCSASAASVLALFSTVTTLISLAPLLLVNPAILLMYEAIVISLVLAIIFAIAFDYLFTGVCRGKE